MTPEPDRGLDAEGFVRREGDPSRVQAEFREVVEGFVEAVRSLFRDDLDSVYLYGSIPRGTARVGLSDLDGQVLLTRTPTQTDQEALEGVERQLTAAYPQVSVVEILLDSRSALVDPADRHDGGFHIRVLCTPLWGPDAGEEVAPHRPDLDLAKGVQGDWQRALARLRGQAGTLRTDPARQAVAERQAAAAQQPDPAQRPDAARELVPKLRVAPEEAALCRAVGRRLSRIAFSWVMPRWGGWSSDPEVMARVVGHVEPGWAAPMADAVRLGWGGPDAADVDLAGRLLDGWAVELTARGEELGS